MLDDPYIRCFFPVLTVLFLSVRLWLWCKYDRGWFIANIVLMAKHLHGLNGAQRLRTRTNQTLYYVSDIYHLKGM